MEQLTVNDIDLARMKILSNSEKLIEESELLFKFGRYTRSYTLAHLALEELSKLHLLLYTGIQLVSGGEVDWKSVKKRFLDHKFKITEAMVTAFIALGNVQLESEETVLKALISMTPDLNDKKNYSLYVSYVGDTFLEPYDLISKADAQYVLDLAEVSLFYNKALGDAIGSLSELDIPTMADTSTADTKFDYYERIVELRYSEFTKEIMKALFDETNTE